MENFFSWAIDFFRGIFGLDKEEPEPEKPPVPPPNQLREAIERHKKTLEERPDDCAAHFLIGEAYMHLRQFRDAMSYLQEAIRIDPNFMESFFLLGKAYVELGRDEEAIEPLQQALERNPDSPLIKNILAEVHKNLCVICGEGKRFKEAFDQFDKAVKLRPRYGEAYLSIGKIYVQLGQYRKAINKFNEALKLDKNLAVEVHSNFGMAYSKLGDRKKAIKHYKEAIQINPKAALPQLYLGHIYMKLGEYQDAVKPFQAAVKYSPLVASDGFYQLGLALSKLERFQEAVAPLKEAVKVSRKNQAIKETLMEAIYQAGVSHGKAERFKESIDTLKEAVEIYPAHGKSHFSLATAYDNCKDGFNAVVHATMARLAFTEHGDKPGEETALRLLAKLYKKYGLNPQDFKKVRLLK